MTLVDSLRDRVHQLGAPDGGPWWQPPAAGALAATGSWLVLALPALVVWVAAAHTPVGWGQALAVASAGWFLAHGARVGVDEATLSVAPLGLWLVAVLLTVRSARRLLAATERAAPGTTWPGRLRRQVVLGFTAGYAGAAAVFWLLTLAAPARPGWSALAVLSVPLLALGWVLLRRHVDGEESGDAGDWLDRLPRWAPRSLSAGVQGAGLLLGLGAALVAVMTAVRWSTVSGLHTAVDAGVVGGVVLTAAQLLLVPNLAVWAVAWLSGPGFQVAEGSSVTLSGALPGLMPMVPVLGALPTDGTWSPWLRLLLLVPVLAGGVLGWLACRSLARLSSWRTKLAAAAAAAITAALGVTVLALLGSGSVGVDRLRAVGTSPLLLGTALVLELVLGAGAYVLVDRLWLRYRPHRR